MKFFTPELYARLQDTDDSAAATADVEWAAAERQYEERLRELGPRLEPVLRQFEGLLLHDAIVRSVSRRGDQLVLVLDRDVPPRDQVTLVYTLAGEPFIDREAILPQFRSSLMQFEYDELDAEGRDGCAPYAHSILFANGWEIRVPFSAVKILFAEPLYPVPALPPIDSPTLVS
jgi:hypothetical protein